MFFNNARRGDKLVVIAAILFIVTSVIADYSFKLVNKRLIYTSRLCYGCNVVILNIDVLRADAIDCGKEQTRTPNICNLAAKSVYFKNHSTQSVLTITNFVSAMTSLYPTSHNVWNDAYSTNLPGVMYFAEILKENGYKTLFFGHVADYWQVVPKGFDEIVDARHIYAKEFKPVETVKRLESWGKPFLFHIYLDDLHFPYLLLNDQVLTNKYGSLIGAPKTSSEFAEMQADYVIQNYKKIFKKEAINANKNLFSGDLSVKKDKVLQLFFDYSSKDAKAKYLLDAWGPTRDTFFKNFDFNNPNSYLYLKENYLEILHLTDERIGDLLKYLDQGELSRNTIIIFKSDHGEEFNEHGLFQHSNTPYQELIHTPLMIYAPGFKPRSSDNLTQEIDVAPTILELLGIEKPQYMQGISLVPLMENKGNLIRDYQIAQKGAADHTAAFRKSEWKLVIKKQTPSELYNLDQDPGEKKNLILSSPDVAESLFDQYLKVINKLPIYGTMEPSLQQYLDEEKRERLKEEGYF